MIAHDEDESVVFTCRYAVSNIESGTCLNLKLAAAHIMEMYKIIFTLLSANQGEIEKSNVKANNFDHVIDSKETTQGVCCGNCYEG